MKLLELIGELIDLHKENGNIDVILQRDAEGNGYESVRGSTLVYQTHDADYVIDSVEEAYTHLGFEESEIRPVIVVYP